MDEWETFHAAPARKRHVRSERNQSARKGCPACAGLRETCPQCVAELRALNGFAPHEESTLLFRMRKVRPYKITVPEYETMIEEQDGRCAICRFQPAVPDDLEIDHNHATGKVRGLLCGPCNQGLGMFQDSPDHLDAALEYLEQRGCYGPNTMDETG